MGSIDPTLVYKTLSLYRTIIQINILCLRLLCLRFRLDLDRINQFIIPRDWVNRFNPTYYLALSNFLIYEMLWKLIIDKITYLSHALMNFAICLCFKMYTWNSTVAIKKGTKMKRRETLKAFKAILFHSSGKNSTCVPVFRLNRKTIFTRRRTVSLKRFLFTTLYTVRQKFHDGPVGRGKSTLWK